MAEYYGYGDSAVLRVRDIAGACTETLLAGTNFLHLAADSISYDILQVYYHPLPPIVTASPGDEAMVSVWVRASRLPTERESREVSRVLQTRFQQRRVDVAFRADSYFISDDSFPIVYRFDPQPRPPSKEVFQRSKQVRCFADEPGIRCRCR